MALPWRRTGRPFDFRYFRFSVCRPRVSWGWEDSNLRIGRFVCWCGLEGNGVSFAFKPDPKLPQAGGIGRKKAKPRRKASAARWEQIRERKLGPCRVCQGVSAGVQLHHLASKGAFLGADTESNLVPLCGVCHDRVTRRDREACAALRRSLTDAEYAYATERMGEVAFEAWYPVVFERVDRRAQ